MKGGGLTEAVGEEDGKVGGGEGWEAGGGVVDCEGVARVTGRGRGETGKASESAYDCCLCSIFRRSCLFLLVS